VVLLVPAADPDGDHAADDREHARDRVERDDYDDAELGMIVHIVLLRAPSRDPALKFSNPALFGADG
jgi:hypothetical protein